MVADLEYALLLQYLSPLDSTGSPVSLLPAPTDARCTAWLFSAAAPTRRPRRIGPQDIGPSPYSSGPSPPSPRVSAGRLACRLGRSPPLPGPSPQPPPTSDFQFPSHLPTLPLRLAGRSSQLEHFPSGPRLCRRPAGPHPRMLSI
jgi:hypothetical protein